MAIGTTQLSMMVPNDRGHSISHLVIVSTSSSREISDDASSSSCGTQMCWTAEFDCNHSMALSMSSVYWHMSSSWICSCARLSASSLFLYQPALSSFQNWASRIVCASVSSTAYFLTKDLSPSLAIQELMLKAPIPTRIWL